jgi:dipeptidyl aminopeptidase/acylaminoacyl peptidase
MTPVVFMPGILNTDEWGAFCTVFNPLGDEFYFVHLRRTAERKPGRISRMRRIDDVWTKPEPLPFSTGEFSENDMCLSPEGDRLIFRSWRPLPDGSAPDDHSWLWVAERTSSGWGQAEPLLFDGEVVRTGYPSIADNGTLYFTHRRDGLLGIYRSLFLNGKYSTPEFVYTLIDTEFIHGDMFVAPDESYMIISGRDPKEKTGFGRLDLFITFRRADETWMEAINMGESINTKAGENCPQVSPDGKYFFFNRYDPDADKGNMYWMDAAVIDELKKKAVGGY